MHSLLLLGLLPATAEERWGALAPDAMALVAPKPFWVFITRRTHGECGSKPGGGPQNAARHGDRNGVLFPSC